MRRGERQPGTSGRRGHVDGSPEVLPPLQLNALVIGFPEHGRSQRRNISHGLGDCALFKKLVLGVR